MIATLKNRLAAAALMVMASFPIASPVHADENAARAVISQQLESFLTGDFTTAYSHASPSIKQLFPTLERFMSMVQSGYLPVLRPDNYAFGRSRQVADGRVLQEVTIRAPDGSDWTALYYMEMQEDGSWKVDGVTLRQGAPGMI